MCRVTKSDSPPLSEFPLERILDSKKGQVLNKSKEEFPTEIEGNEGEGGG